MDHLPRTVAYGWRSVDGAQYAANAAESIREGVGIAADVIDSGEAMEALNRLITYTQSVAHEDVAV